MNKIEVMKMNFPVEVGKTFSSTVNTSGHPSKEKIGKRQNLKLIASVLIHSFIWVKSNMCLWVKGLIIDSIMLYFNWTLLTLTKVQYNHEVWEKVQTCSRLFKDIIFIFEMQNQS